MFLLINNEVVVIRDLTCLKNSMELIYHYLQLHSHIDEPMNRAPRHTVNYWWGTEISASETTLFGLFSLSPDGPKTPKAILFYLASEITTRCNKSLLHPFPSDKKRIRRNSSLSNQMFFSHSFLQLNKFSLSFFCNQFLFYFKLFI